MTSALPRFIFDHHLIRMNGLAADYQDKAFHGKWIFGCLGQRLRAVRRRINAVVVSTVVIVKPRCIEQNGDGLPTRNILCPGHAVQSNVDRVDWR